MTQSSIEELRGCEVGSRSAGGLSEEVLQRLRLRAASTGRSLESEMRALLDAGARSSTLGDTNESLGMTMARARESAGITEAAWQELDRSLQAARESRSDGIHRWIDFEGAEFDHPGRVD